MKKLFPFFLAVLFFNNIYSQIKYDLGDTLYVLAKSGLVLRAEANIRGERITIIPYGTKVKAIEIAGSENIEAISRIKYQNELLPAFYLDGNWLKVKFENMEGFVFDGYLSKYPPIMFDNKFNVESLNIWAKREFGIDRILKEKRIVGSDYHDITILYNNGMIGNESGSTGWFNFTYVLPYATLQDGFLLFDVMTGFTDKYNVLETNSEGEMRLIESECNYLKFWLGMPGNECEIKQMGSIIILSFFGSC